MRLRLGEHGFLPGEWDLFFSGEGILKKILDSNQKEIKGIDELIEVNNARYVCCMPSRYCFGRDLRKTSLRPRENYFVYLMVRGFEPEEYEVFCAGRIRNFSI